MPGGGCCGDVDLRSRLFLPLVECECIPYFPHLCFHKCRVLPTWVTPNPQRKSYLWLQECILMEISTINIKMSCGKKKPIGKEIRKKINQQQHRSTLYDHVFSPNWLPQRPIGCAQGGTGNTTSLSLSPCSVSVYKASRWWVSWSPLHSRVCTHSLSESPSVKPLLRSHESSLVAVSHFIGLRPSFLETSFAMGRA